MKHITPLVLATCGLLLSLTLAAPAAADGRGNRHDRHRVDHRHRYHDGYGHRARDGHHNRYGHHARYGHYDRYQRRSDRFHRPVDIPHRIHHRYVRSFRRYFERHEYFAPHRHNHAVYSFPVVVDGYRKGRRYDYCDGELFRPPGF